MLAAGPVASAFAVPSAPIVVAASPPLYVTTNGTVYLDQSQLHLTVAGSLTSGSIGRGFGKPNSRLILILLQAALRCATVKRFVRLYICNAEMPALPAGASLISQNWVGFRHPAFRSLSDLLLAA